MAAIYPSSNSATFQHVTLSFLDSPATASAQSYTLGFRSTNTSGVMSCQRDASLGSIILMEVAA
jgi:hypothetical protein